jgi:hypothetical protein
VQEIISLIDDPSHILGRKRLKELLEKPEGVSKEEFIDWSGKDHSSGDREDKEKWEKLLPAIGKRFGTAWDQGQKPQNPLSVRSVRQKS